MSLILYNKTTVVIPSVTTGVFSNVEVNEEYLTTKFGLFFPSSGGSLCLLRFLRAYGEGNMPAELVISDICLGFLINNYGTLEVVWADSKGFMQVYDMPAAPNNKWIAAMPLDFTMGKAVTEAVQSMTAENAADWITNNTPESFLKPLKIHLPSWRRKRSPGNLLKCMDLKSKE